MISFWFSIVCLCRFLEVHCARDDGGDLLRGEVFGHWKELGTWGILSPLLTNARNSGRSSTPLAESSLSRVIASPGETKGSSWMHPRKKHVSHHLQQRKFIFCTRTEYKNNLYACALLPFFGQKLMAIFWKGGKIVRYANVKFSIQTNKRYTFICSKWIYQQSRRSWAWMRGWNCGVLCGKT